MNTNTRPNHRNHPRKPRQKAGHTAPNVYEVTLQDGSVARVFANNKGDAANQAVSFEDKFGAFYPTNQRPMPVSIKAIEFEVGDSANVNPTRAYMPPSVFRAMSKDDLRDAMAVRGLPFVTRTPKDAMVNALIDHTQDGFDAIAESHPLGFFPSDKALQRREPVIKAALAEVSA